MNKIKELQTQVADLEEALYEVIYSNRIEYAKEVAAEALGINLDETLEVKETLDFSDDRIWDSMPPSDDNDDPADEIYPLDFTDR